MKERGITKERVEAAGYTLRKLEGLSVEKPATGKKKGRVGEKLEPSDSLLELCQLEKRQKKFHRTHQLDKTRDHRKKGGEKEKKLSKELKRGG